MDNLHYTEKRNIFREYYQTHAQFKSMIDILSEKVHEDIELQIKENDSLLLAFNLDFGQVRDIVDRAILDGYFVSEIISSLDLEVLSLNNIDPSYVYPTMFQGHRHWAIHFGDDNLKRILSEDQILYVFIYEKMAPNGLHVSFYPEELIRALQNDGSLDDLIPKDEEYVKKISDRIYTELHNKSLKYQRK